MRENNCGTRHHVGDGRIVPLRGAMRALKGPGSQLVLARRVEEALARRAPPCALQRSVRMLCTFV